MLYISKLQDDFYDMGSSGLELWYRRPVTGGPRHITLVAERLLRFMAVNFPGCGICRRKVPLRSQFKSQV